MTTKKIYPLLLDFYGTGKSERWTIPYLPRKDEVITISGISKTVSNIEYIVTDDACNIFIRTEKK